MMTMSVGAYTVFLKLPSEAVITIEVAPTDTVAYIKQALNDREGYPLDELRLFFNGFEMLVDDATLADYNVQREQTITVALRGESFDVTVKVGGQPGTSSVYGSYAAGTEADTVYSVDITWGAMEFVYTASGTKQWNADSHTYTESITAAWTESGNTITVTNHSNKSVSVVFAFERDAGITDGITGAFTYSKGATDNTVTLAAGVENQPDSADKVVATLKLSGELSPDKTELTKVGTVTVTLE